MNELLDIYDLEGNFIGTQDRASFKDDALKECKATGVVSKKIKTTRLILMNTNGRIYLQKRSIMKAENAGLYDKSIGGHVIAGQSMQFTIIKECAEELGFPAVVLAEKEFVDAMSSIDLKILGILKKIDHISQYNSTRVLKDGTMLIQPFITDIYLGYYDGPIRFADGESSGLETYDKLELDYQILKNPERYTEDLKFLVNRYSSFLIPVR